jgi:hypothetical protein
MSMRPSGQRAGQLAKIEFKVTLPQAAAKTPLLHTDSRAQDKPAACPIRFWIVDIVQGLLLGSMADAVPTTSPGGRPVA